MANAQAFCTQAKADLMNGLHAFGASVIRAATTKDTYYGALYLKTASRGAGDTVYNNTGELAGTGNYTQGGQAFATATPPATANGKAYFTPSASIVWTNLTSSGVFDAILIYNWTSATKLALSVHTFGDQSVTAGTFTLTMPTNDETTGLIRIE